jgi:hypothetical protein
MTRLGFVQLFPEYSVTIDRYCSDDGREDRQNLMMLACAAWAVDEGFEVQVSWDGETAIDANSVDVVFLSLFSVAAYRLKAAVDRFTAAGCRVIVCGPHAVSFAGHCYQAGADAVVGRCTRELFTAILSDIRGGTLQRHYTAAGVLTSFPRQGRFRELGFLPPQSFMNVLSSTGCPFTCGFCTDATTRYAAVAASKVVASIASSDEPMVVFNDPTFGVGATGKSLLAALPPLGRSLSGFTTSSMLRDASFRQALYRAGFVLVEVGIESINTPFAKNRHVEFFETFAACDFLILVNYIWGYDERDFDGRTAEFLITLSRRCPNVFPMIFTPFSLPETEQHRALVEGERLFDPSYLCIGNEIPSLRLPGLDSPRAYCQRLAVLTDQVGDGLVARMRNWIDANARFSAKRRQLLQTMVGRHEAAAAERAAWAGHITSAAPDEYRAFSHDVMTRALPQFTRYDDGGAAW